MNIVEHVQGLDQIEQRTPEWYEARKHLLTASDAASAIGLNPYQSSKQCLQKKVFNDKFTGNFATIHGNKYEDEARFLFAKLYNLETWDVGLFRHKTIKWLGGSPDGIASDGSLLEIKCPIKREIKHEIPSYYYPQVQICMEVLDIPKCYFIQYKPETYYQDPIMDVLEIPRSKEWFATYHDKLKAFWDSVLYYREHPDVIRKKPRQLKEKVKIEKEAVSHFIDDPDD
jgi:putative phage-type endonuclease